MEDKDPALRRQISAMCSLQLALTSLAASLARNQAWLVEQLHPLLSDQDGALKGLSVLEQLHASVQELQSHVALVQNELSGPDQEP